MTIGLRGYEVSTYTGVWYGGFSPHHPFHESSGHGPRLGADMLRPMIHAPTLSKPRDAYSSSAPVDPPSPPCIPSNVRVWISHPCSDSPPTPSGFSRL